MLLLAALSTNPCSASFLSHSVVEACVDSVARVHALTSVQRSLGEGSLLPGEEQQTGRDSRSPVLVTSPPSWPRFSDYATHEPRRLPVDATVGQSGHIQQLQGPHGLDPDPFVWKQPGPALGPGLTAHSCTHTNHQPLIDELLSVWLTTPPGFVPGRRGPAPIQSLTSSHTPRLQSM